jgi:hypothetical protein
VNWAAFAEVWASLAGGIVLAVYVLWVTKWTVDRDWAFLPCMAIALGPVFVAVPVVAGVLS